MQIRQYDVVELHDGREVVVLDFYDDPPGYEVELSDLNITSDPDYLGPLSFGVAPEEIKRVLDPSEIKPVEIDLSEYD